MILSPIHDHLPRNLLLSKSLNEFMQLYFPYDDELQKPAETGCTFVKVRQRPSDAFSDCFGRWSRWREWRVFCTKWQWLSSISSSTPQQWTLKSTTMIPFASPPSPFATTTISSQCVVYYIYAQYLHSHHNIIRQNDQGERTRCLWVDIGNLSLEWWCPYSLGRRKCGQYVKAGVLQANCSRDQRFYHWVRILYNILLKKSCLLQ